ncbi:MAG: pyrimidine-nucleoside phosphorylase [Lachnospiraceae bacterium]|nr:pyrimidine-nucleoside phosphorylase [Lachnospiraceae bacterium]
MRMYDLIMKKRNNDILTQEEIRYMVGGFTKGEIPDYQMSAMLMAIYFRGMNEAETLNLTMAMADSGDTLDLSGIQGVKCDKHSTGGVGDKVSLILGPMAAAAGIPVAKMSGRGLGHTGGTIDKLESIAGFRTVMEQEDFIRQVNDIGIALVGQTAHLAPADKKIYALRDVTATVDSLPLIASSIMSKKLAAGADTIVLDVKCGNGAFMREEAAAVALAKTMVRIGNGAGRHTIAVISDMNEPLGYMVGNSLEVWEALEVLQGRGDEKLTELCITLGAYMLYGTGLVKRVTNGKRKMKRVLEDGLAYKKFMEWMKAQGADTSSLSNTKQLLSAKYRLQILSDQKGYVREILADEVGIAALMLGAGRENLDSVLDYQAGFRLLKKTGDYVEEQEPIAVCYANDNSKVAEACERFQAAYRFSRERQEPKPFIKAVIQE